eukprot:m.222490 g.222490  ORF g.222490 m.222490 type:complete len:73 (+) comp25825_c0_seq19:1994-2212(+)
MHFPSSPWAARTAADVSSAWKGSLLANLMAQVTAQVRCNMYCEVNKASCQAILASRNAEAGWVHNASLPQDE